MKAPKTPPNVLILISVLETTNDIQDSVIGTVEYVLKEVINISKQKTASQIHITSVLNVHDIS